MNAASTVPKPDDGASRVVLDTNVLVSLFVFVDGRFAALRSALETGRWRALTSPRCQAEFSRVLAYPMFGLDAAAQSAAFDAYIRLAEDCGALPAKQIPLPQCRDRDDQKFLELARDGDARLLVTADKALLKLARRRRFDGLLRIVTPEAALGLLAGSDSAIVGAG